jgi:hypothetical protein
MCSGAPLNEAIHATKLTKMWISRFKGLIPRFIVAHRVTMVHNTLGN